MTGGTLGDVIQRFLPAEDATLADGHVLYECRHCGRKYDDEPAECSDCGATEIAAYEFPEGAVDADD